MTWTQDNRRDPEWTETLTRACKLARDMIHTAEGRAAIEWFNSEYSEEAVRRRREESDADIWAEKPHRASASLIPGTPRGEPAEIWRLAAALTDLYRSSPKWGNIEGWEDRATERVEAAKFVLMAALVIDRDAGEYLGDLIDVTRLSKAGDADRLGRGFASATAGFDDGEGEWPDYLEGAVAVLTPDTAEDKGGGESAGPALTENETRVLQTMAVFDPVLLVSAAVIAGEMDVKIRLSARTIGPIVQKLIELRLAERPKGGRSGARLTTAGRRLAAKIAD